MIRLGMNIDHVATVRQARRAKEPDPVTAAALALIGGADGITIHLREDRRHIQDRDLRVLRETVPVGLRLLEADVAVLRRALDRREQELADLKTRHRASLSKQRTTAVDTTLSPLERLKTIYPRYLDAAPVVVDGLSTQVFRDGTAYQGEDLIHDPSRPEQFVLRCTRLAGLTPPMCLHERRIAGADITVRFPREWLSDWRRVSDGVERLIAGFKPVAR